MEQNPLGPNLAEKVMINAFWLLVIAVAIAAICIFDELVVKGMFLREHGYQPAQEIVQWGTLHQL